MNEPVTFLSENKINLNNKNYIGDNEQIELVSAGKAPDYMNYIKKKLEANYNQQQRRSVNLAPNFDNGPFRAGVKKIIIITIILMNVKFCIMIRN